MLRKLGIIREAAKIISEAANGTIKDLNDKRIEQEPHFTDRMLGRVAQAIEGYEAKGVKWYAKTFTDRGRNSQESLYGADFMGVFDIQIHGYSVKKGFLAQAKLIEKNGYISTREYERMRKQCRNMLKLSPASYLFLYSKETICVVPGIAVVASKNLNPHELYSRKLNNFFEEHFASFIGDKDLCTSDTTSLNELAERYRTRSILQFMVSDEFDKNEQVEFL